MRRSKLSQQELILRQIILKGHQERSNLLKFLGSLNLNGFKKKKKKRERKKAFANVHKTN